MSNKLDVKFFKVADVKSPVRATAFAAGIDLFVPNDFKEITLLAGDSVLIPSGLKFRIPDGYALVANNKSGVAVKKKLICGAAVIDQDYKGIVHLDMHYIGNESTTIFPGEKILQLLLEKQEYSTVTEVHSEEELFKDMESERGEGGFGSTGNV